MPRVPTNRIHDHGPDPDRRTAAIMYGMGMPAHDPIRKRWPGADVPVPRDDRRSRLADLLDRARKIAKRKP